MRDRIEKYVLLPFSLGCVSESSISVGSESISSDHLHQRSNRRNNYSSDHNNSSPPTKSVSEEEEYEEEENLKSFLSAPKFQRLFKNFKNISHLFVYKEEDDDDDVDGEREEIGMEIGFPTDVKHVTHIGIDGSTTSILSKAWDLKQSQFNNNNIHGVSHQIL